MQQELAGRLGVYKMTVSRWERGQIRPSGKSLAALEAVRCEAIRKGVIVPSRRARGSGHRKRGQAVRSVGAGVAARAADRERGAPVKRRRLHWFWRGAIATVVACCCGGLEVAWSGVINGVAEPFFERLYHFVQLSIVLKLAVNAACFYFLPTLLLGLTVYGLVTRWSGGDMPHDGETHCRKCGYVLRGISEPRCPECGERI